MHRLDALRGEAESTNSAARAGPAVLSHHLAAIVSAVVLTDASNIEDGIVALKQSAMGLAVAKGDA